MPTTTRTVSGDMTEEQKLHSALSTSLQRNGGSPQSTISLLGKVARESVWKNLPRHHTRDKTGFASFTDYIQAHTDHGGLGMRTADVMTLLEVRTEIERRAPDYTDSHKLAADREVIRKVIAGDIGPAAQHGEIGGGHTRDGGTISADPNTNTSILARLKRDDPDLAGAVARGEITANAAARQKGWRFPRVELRNPVTVAARIRQHFTDNEIRALIDELDHLPTYEKD
jgi:hypothetical protein